MSLCTLGAGTCCILRWYRIGRRSGGDVSARATYSKVDPAAELVVSESWFPVSGNAVRNGKSQSLFEYPKQGINKAVSLLKPSKASQAGCWPVKHNRHLAARKANTA